MAWILIVSWLSVAGAYEIGFTSKDLTRSTAVAMQEFSDLKHCQFASVELQKIAPAVRTVCVPKGDKK